MGHRGAVTNGHTARDEDFLFANCSLNGSGLYAELGVEFGGFIDHSIFYY